MVGQPLDAQAARQVLGQQPKDLCMVRFAQHIHLALDIRLSADRRERGQCRLGIPLPSRIVRWLEHLSVEQLVEHDRMAHQVVGCPAGLADHAQQLSKSARKLHQQGQISWAPGDRLEQVGKASEPGVIGRADLGGFAQGHLEQLVDAPLRVGPGKPIASTLMQRIDTGLARLTEDPRRRRGIA